MLVSLRSLLPMSILSNGINSFCRSAKLVLSGPCAMVDIRETDTAIAIEAYMTVADEPINAKDLGEFQVAKNRAQD